MCVFRESRELIFDGFLISHLLFRLSYFHVHNFCIVFFDDLVNKFSSVEPHLKPCLDYYGIDLKIPLKEKFPIMSPRKAKHDMDEVLDAEQKASLFRFLNDKLYKDSNSLLRGILRHKFKREELLEWEKTDYKQQEEGKRWR